MPCISRSELQRWTRAILQQTGENQQDEFAWIKYNAGNGGYMKDRKAKAKLIILLGIIWVIITLPLPWIVNNPLVSESQFNTILGIIGVMSIPFVILGVVWTLKPELTT